MSADDQIRAISDWVDAGLAGKDPEARLWHRVAKIGEEHGEVIEALIGVTNGNPRKPHSHTMDDVRKELLDVALCALCAYAHTDRDAATLAALADHAQMTYHRAGLGGAEEPPRKEPNEKLLLSTTNAAVWAAEFVGAFGGDEGLMIGWFANAIEVGREAGRTAGAEPPRSERAVCGMLAFGGNASGDAHRCTLIPHRGDHADETHGWAQGRHPLVYPLAPDDEEPRSEPTARGDGS